MGYPYLIGRRGYTMDHGEVKIALGLQEFDPKRPFKDKKIPADVSAGWRDVNGVQVCYLTSEAARQHWNRPGSTTPMRALARCPECDRIVAASRINQHARVHHGGVKRRY